MYALELKSELIETLWNVNETYFNLLAGDAFSN